MRAPLLRTAPWRFSKSIYHVHGRYYNSTWASHIQHPSNRVQVFLSKSHNPALNLSIEHYLFQKSPQDSIILFLYINSPSVIIGRNQNPWLETNLRKLTLSTSPDTTAKDTLDHVRLVRRRSGGGTVFHDEGNVNWSIICPSSIFTRDRHAEMVVRALRGLGMERARVNERHDIVLDQGKSSTGQVNKDDTHRTPFTTDEVRPLKVSGSAYKLTRGRAMHHATALLSSPHIKEIGSFLRSPGRGVIEAKGVESVSSPITNIGLSNDAFMDSVITAFEKQYECPDIETQEVGDTQLGVQEIAKGMAELESEAWTFGQTPRFTVSVSLVSTKSDGDQAKAVLHVRHGVIEDVDVHTSDVDGQVHVKQVVTGALSGRHLHSIQDWRGLFSDLDTAGSGWDWEQLERELAEKLPVPKI